MAENISPEQLDQFKTAVEGVTKGLWNLISSSEKYREELRFLENLISAQTRSLAGFDEELRKYINQLQLGEISFKGIKVAAGDLPKIIKGIIELEKEEMEKSYGFSYQFSKNFQKSLKDAFGVVATVGVPLFKTVKRAFEPKQITDAQSFIKALESLATQAQLAALTAIALGKIIKGLTDAIVGTVKGGIKTAQTFIRMGFTENALAAYYAAKFAKETGRAYYDAGDMMKNFITSGIVGIRDLSTVMSVNFGWYTQVAMAADLSQEEFNRLMGNLIRVTRITDEFSKNLRINFDELFNLSRTFGTDINIVSDWFMEFARNARYYDDGIRKLINSFYGFAAVVNQFKDINQDMRNELTKSGIEITKRISPEFLLAGYALLGREIATTADAFAQQYFDMVKMLSTNPFKALQVSFTAFEKAFGRGPAQIMSFIKSLGMPVSPTLIKYLEGLQQLKPGEPITKITSTLSPGELNALIWATQDPLEMIGRFLGKLLAGFLGGHFLIKLVSGGSMEERLAKLNETYEKTANQLIAIQNLQPTQPNFTEGVK